MKSLTPNTLLQNRYLVVQLIGKGGMGEVYLAVDQRLGSAVALKRTFFTDDEMLGDAFEREARTLARLRHPVLPKVTDHFIENDNQFLVMDHISGDDLSKRLESAEKPFPLNWVLFWADQLLDALNYLHSYNPPIVHRDIKPQNLKLTDENHIVLLDFGLAKDNVGETRITTEGSVVGFTPHYAPMEQIRGVGTDPKSDLYSLSATLYQLLTNKVPHDTLSRADMLLGKMPDPLVPINEINPEVSVKISEIIAKGMAISLDERFSSAREMQKRLRDAYAQMQNAMSAQTAVFNLKTIEPQVNEIKQPDIAPPVTGQIDPFATLINEKPISASDTASHKPDSTGEKTGQMSLADIAETISDSVPRNNVSEVNSEPKQADVKTEVFLAGSGILPSVEDESADNFESANEEFSEDLTAKATVPFASYKSEGGSIPPEIPKAFDSGDNYGESAEEDFNFPPSEDFSDVEEVYTDSDYNAANTGYAQPDYDDAEDDYAEKYDEYTPQTPPPKKSAGKGIFIAGGFLLLFLIVGAAGAGWYVYNNSKNVVEQPQPTPEPMAEITNTDVVLSDDADTDTNSEPTNSTVVSDTTETKPPPSVKPPPPNKTTTTRKPPPTPKITTTKPPPKPKQTPNPKKDDRTVPLP